METTRVVWPSDARRTAREADKLVLPTPPLPLTRMYLRSVPCEIASNADSCWSVVADAARRGAAGARLLVVRDIAADRRAVIEGAAVLLACRSSEGV